MLEPSDHSTVGLLQSKCRQDVFIPVVRIRETPHTLRWGGVRFIYIYIYRPKRLGVQVKIYTAYTISNTLS